MVAAASTNFDAVALMRYGRYNEAISLLKIALEQIAMEVAVEEARGRQYCNSTDILVVPSQIESVSALPEDELAGTIQPESGMYTKVFVFPHANSSVGLKRTERSSTECSVVCMFNLGVAVHLEGVRTGRTLLLTKASQLFIKVYQVLSQCQLIQSDPLVHVLLACSLNLASAYGDLWNISQAIQWRKNYVTIFNWVVSSRDGNALGLMDQQDAYFFALNSILFQSAGILFAAAA